MFELQTRVWMSSLARLARRLASGEADEALEALFVIRLYDLLLCIVPSLREALDDGELLWLQEARDSQCHAWPNSYVAGRKYTRSTLIGRLDLDIAAAALARFRSRPDHDDRRLTRALALRLVHQLESLVVEPLAFPRGASGRAAVF